MTLWELRAEIPLIFVGLGSYFPHVNAGAGVCRLLHHVFDAFILHFSPQEPYKQGKTHLSQPSLYSLHRFNFYLTGYTFEVIFFRKMVN